jgi:putative PIN family toxin of toxin-antitoxin system
MVVPRTKNRKIVLDTDLWISLLIGNKITELRTLCNHKYLTVYICQELIDEFITVASSPVISKYVTKRNIDEVLKLMEISCIKCAIDPTATAKKIISSRTTVIYRTDLYLISFSDTVNIDYIITADSHLFRQRRHIDTKMMTFAKFMDRIWVFTDKESDNEPHNDIRSLLDTSRVRRI